MNTLTKIASSLGVLCSLSACGGGGGADFAAGGVPTVTAPLVETGSANTNFESQTSAVTYNGEVVSRPTDTKRDLNTSFVHFYDRSVSDQPNNSALGNGDIVTIRANTGNTHAFAFGNTAGSALFTQYGRSLETQVPTMGTATYTGNYGGLYQTGSGTAAIGDGQEIIGDTKMSINFTDGTASGTITNRHFAVSPQTTLEDIQLVGGEIDQNGMINGTAMGGRPNLGGFENLPERPFAAAIGGADASEVAGYARVKWGHSDGTVYHETGVFSARQD